MHWRLYWTAVSSSPVSVFNLRNVLVPISIRLSFVWILTLLISELLNFDTADRSVVISTVVWFWHCYLSSCLILTLLIWQLLKIPHTVLMYDSMDIYLAMHHKIESVRSAFLYLEREGKGIYPIRMYLQHGFQGDKSYEHCSINSINLQIENLPVSVVLAHSFTGLPVHGPRYNQTMHLIRSSSSWIRGESWKGSQAFPEGRKSFTGGRFSIGAV